MAEVFGRRNLPQYINTILTKKIEESLQNSRENSRIRNTSVNSHSQKIIPTNNIVQNKYQNSQNKTNRKVCFKQIIRNKKEDSQQKLAFTFNDSFKLIPAKKPNKINQVSIKSIKSLDSSFAWGGNEVQQNQLSLSIRYNNPQLHQCKLLINEILKKLKFFDDSRFTDKQLVSWLEGYFEKEQAIVGKVFLRLLHTYHNKKRKTQIQIQRNREMLYQKVGQKHKDSFRNSQRYVSSSQIEQYDRFLQNLYIEKSKIKMKQIEQNVTKKMSFVCKQIRQQQNNDYVCSLRKKPSDIANFITDLKTFENDLGSLKRITKMNRSRFQLLNDTDLQIEMQAVKLNQHSYELRKNRKVLIIYD